jgi:hypothetical protein
MTVTFECESGTRIIVYEDTDCVVITTPLDYARGGPICLTIDETLEALKRSRSERARRSKGSA